MVKLNGYNVVKGRFPNNEVDYEPWSFTPFPISLSSDSLNTFTLIFDSNEDLFNLQIVKKMYDDRYIGNAKTKLEIHYFPYCQMDRPMDTHGFSLKYVAQIINELKFDMVEVYDPHSNVLPALLNHCKEYYPVKDFLLDETVINDGFPWDLLFYPDNGAAKKYSELLDVKKYRFGNKKRNLDTGEIICYEVLADKSDIEGKKILIVDDMVMGGRTFVEAAKALREMGASQVDLYVTHLKPESRKFYNSKGNGLIDNIYSVDTLEMIQYFNMPEPRP
jgi:ribose-phosphate pyrophosphokinase